MRDPYLEDIAKAGPTSSKKFRNTSRNFHSWINRNGKTLPVKISRVKVRVVEQRPKVKQIEKTFPMIGLSSWAEYLLKNSPGFLLGGHSLDSTGYKDMLEMFWNRYSKLDPSHPVFQRFEQGKRGNLIPYCVHGDEGRGKAKTPVLISSYQMIIPPGGLETTNLAGYLCCKLVLSIFLVVDEVLLSWIFRFLTMPLFYRHSFSTRLLANIMPSKLLASKDRTLDDMNQFMANDLTDCFNKGVQASSNFYLCLA